MGRVISDLMLHLTITVVVLKALLQQISEENFVAAAVCLDFLPPLPELQQ